MTATVPLGVVDHLDGGELGDLVLRVPASKCMEIHEQSSTAAEERERLIHYYLNYSEYASWSRLAGRLYSRQHCQLLGGSSKLHVCNYM